MVCVGGVVVGLPDPPFADPPLLDPSPPLRRTAQNFALFFPSPAPIFTFHSSLPLLGVFSLNFGGVFEGRDPEMHVWARELQTSTFDGPGTSKRHQNEKTPEKERKWGRRRKKKREILGSPPFGAAHPSGPQTHWGSASNDTFIQIHFIQIEDNFT